MLTFNLVCYKMTINEKYSRYVFDRDYRTRIDTYLNSLEQEYLYLTGRFEDAYEQLIGSMDAIAEAFQNGPQAIRFIRLHEGSSDIRSLKKDVNWLLKEVIDLRSKWIRTKQRHGSDINHSTFDEWFREHNRLLAIWDNEVEPWGDWRSMTLTTSRTRVS